MSKYAESIHNSFTFYRARRAINKWSHWKKKTRKRIGGAVRYRFVAKRQLIKKLEGLFKNQVSAMWFFVKLLKLAFLKVLTFMKDFPDNTEFNKHHFWLVSTLNRSRTKLCDEINSSHDVWLRKYGSWVNGIRCRDGMKVLWFHSHLVWLYFEGSIPTCTCFHSENVFDLYSSYIDSIFGFAV